MFKMTTSVLGNIASVQTGPFGSQLHKDDYVDSGTPIITVEHLVENKISHENLPLVSDEDKIRLSKYILKEGDIVFSRVGSVDRCAYVSKNEDGWLFSGRCLRIRVDETKVNPRYLSYYFAQSSFKSYIRKIAVGATMPSLNTAIMSELELNLPPLPVQKKIAAILSSLDDKIEINTRMNKVLEETARALFHRWFVEFEFPNDEGKPYKSSGGRMIASEMGEIPEGWRVGTVGDIAVLNPESWSSKNKPKNINYLDLSNVRNGTIQNIISYSFDIAPSRARRVLRIGDTIIGTVRPGNRSFALISENGLTGSTGFAVLRSHNMLTRYYLYLHLTQDSMIQTFTRLATGGAYPAITPQLIVEQTILLPSQKILNLFHESVVAIFHRINLNAREIRFLNEIRETLLPELLSVQE